MIRRPPRSTQSRSSAASDVYKRQTRLRRCDQPSHHAPLFSHLPATEAYRGQSDARPVLAPPSSLPLSRLFPLLKQLPHPPYILRCRHLDVLSGSLHNADPPTCPLHQGGIVSCGEQELLILPVCRKD